MPWTRRFSRISASPDAKRVRPTSSNSSASLVSATWKQGWLHSGGSWHCRPSTPRSTTRANSGGPLLLPLLCWLELVRVLRMLRQERLVLDREKGSLREEEKKSLVPNPPLVSSCFSVADDLPVFSFTTGKAAAAASSWSVAAALLTDSKTRQGNSRIWQSSCSSFLSLSRVSTMITSMPSRHSSWASWRVMILWKPLRSSFSSAQISSTTRSDSCAVSSFVEKVSSRARCCVSRFRCHSFCVRRHWDRNSIRTWFWPPWVLVRFTTSACTHSRSPPSPSSMASHVEWYVAAPSENTESQTPETLSSSGIRMRTPVCDCAGATPGTPASDGRPISITTLLVEAALFTVPSRSGHPRRTQANGARPASGAARSTRNFKNEEGVISTVGLHGRS
mmetsp:Transcript_23440/g.65638  ORF Transcript_23440/g.65638 Transcript_23440/m.65638 type:complete len:392 (+) Transcript_23440:1192-2367(+)